MRILVTGGAGFIGSNFVNDLVANHDQWSEIIIIDALTYAGNLSNLENALLDKRVKFIHGDIRNLELVNLHMPKIDTVVHFAAESHVDRSISNPNDFISTNVLGTSILLKSATDNNVKRFLHVSTDEVYGSIENGSWTENSPILPNSPYSASKASSDLIALAYWKTFGLPVIISRCSNNFGQNQFPEKLIPLAITNLIDGLPIPIYGTGLNSRDWLHVSDHCSALNSIIQNGTPGEIYNIGGGTEMSNIQTAKLIIELMNMKETLIKFVEDRKGHDFRYSVDFSKIAKTCGHKPTKKFEDSLGETIHWYKNNESWWRRIKNIN